MTLKPGQVAVELIHIATKLQNSRNPDRELVVKDIKRIIASIEHEEEDLSELENEFNRRIKEKEIRDRLNEFNKRIKEREISGVNPNKEEEEAWWAQSRKEADALIKAVNALTK